MKVGGTVDNFCLFDQNNNNFVLYDNLEYDILLVFYPKDNTPICTKQLVDYSLNQQELIKHGIKVVGININSVESHKTFCINSKIDFPILCDSERKVSKSFKALNFFGRNKRKLVLVGKDKKVKFQKSTLPVFFIDLHHLLNDLIKTQPI